MSRPTVELPRRERLRELLDAVIEAHDDVLDSEGVREREASEYAERSARKALLDYATGVAPPPGEEPSE